MSPEIASKYKCLLSKAFLWISMACCLVPSGLEAQQQRFYNWYFGNQAGLSFASGSPVALTNGIMSTTEGCASISDAAGNLMFYTNGINVWNSSHALMTNGTGLTGHQSSTQSSIIVQRPLSNNIYYIFTADADAGANGIRYSEVNMSLSAGLGAVTATKNVLLQTPSCEKLTAVRHCNNRDIWIVSHDWNSTQFRVWLITPTGVNTTPVLSSTGSLIGGITQSGYGQLKANPDGNKLLAGYYGFGGTNGTNKFELYDFNNSTGVVSNGITLATETGAYGCEFSPNGRVAYGATNQGRLVQFDLCAGSTAAIQNSKVVLGILGPFIGSLQLGPDGKVYVSRNTTSLSVINNPNVVGMGCGFVNAAIPLASRTSSMGLPNLASFYVRPEIAPFTFVANCTNVNFTSPTVTTSANSCANASNAIVSTTWDFGDPASGAANTSTQLNPNHVFSGTGTYNVRLILNLGCYSDTLIQPVSITGFNVNTSSVPASCGVSNGTATVTPAVAGTYTYLWSNGATTQTASGLNAGLYTVTITSSTGCTATASVSVGSSGSVNMTVNTSNVACAGGSTGSATATVTGGTAPFTYNWSNGATGASVNGLTAGNYSVTLTDNSGCSVTQNFTITQALPLSATATAAAATCSSPTSSASVSVIGGTAPYAYLWSNGSTSASATGLSSGVHTVTVTDANGCTITRTVNVVQPAALSGSITSTPATCNGAGNGTASASITGGTAPLAYAWSNGANTASVNNLAAGAYTLTVTDASGCTLLLNTNVGQPAALGVTANVNPGTCSANSGSATASVTGGNAPYTYNWSTGGTSSSATGLGSGAYTVTVTDASGCQASTNFTINQPAALQVVLSSTAVSCNGAGNGSVNSTVTGGSAPYVYLWNNGATTVNLSNVNGGSYTLNITDASGCTASQSVVVIEPTGMSLNTSMVPATCGGADGTATVNVSGGQAPYTYSWNTSPVQTTATAVGLSPGSYIVTVTDANGCQRSANANIPNTGGLSISVQVNSPVACFGGSDGSASAIANGGNAPYNYVWSNGATGSTITNLLVGTYTCTVSDANGCNASDVVTIVQPNQLVANATSVAVSCFGLSNGSAQATATGGMGPYTYSWSTGSTGATATGLQAGAYTVTVSDQNNCTANVAVNVTEPSQLLAVPQTTMASCAGNNDGAIVLALSGGLAPYTVSWLDGSTGTNRNGLPAGTYQYNVNDASGCSVSGNIVIVEPVVLQAAVNSTNVSCFGDSNGSITLNVTGGNAPYSIAWTGGQTGGNLTNLAAGTYSAVVTDQAGCQTIINTQINSPDSISVNYTATASNCSGSNGSLLFTASGGIVPYTYALDGNAFQNSPFFGSLTAGTHSIEVRDAAGCSVVRDALVSSPVNVGIQIGNSTDVSCAGASDASAQAVISGGTAPYSIQWSSGESGTQASQLSAGANQVTVTDASGCSSFLSFTVNEPDPIQISAQITNVTCYAGTDGSASVTVTGGSGAYTYQWETGAQGPGVTGLPVGFYDITVSDANGCSASDTLFVAQPTQPILIQSSIIPGDCGNNAGAASVTVTGGTGTYTYSWNTNATQNTPVANNLAPGTYTVTVSDANNCSAQSTINISGYQPVTVIVDSISAVTCFGGSDGFAALSVSGGQAPYFYQWGTGPQPGPPQSLPAGTYTISVIDANGCIGNVNFIIPQPAQLNVSTTVENPDCYGQAEGSVELNIQGGVEPYNINWSNGFSGIDNINLMAGVYFCTVSDANGCLATIEEEVTQPEEFVAQLIVDQPGCSGIANGYIAVLASGGTGFYTYQWNTGQQASELDGLAPGSYSVNVFDENACLVQLSAELSTSALFEIFVEGDSLICEGDQAIIEVSASGIHNVFSYVWDHGVTGNLFVANPSETRTYTVTVTDSVGCVGYDSITVYVQPKPELAILADDTSGCAPFCAKLNSEADAAITYVWTIADSIQFNTASALPCFDQPGLYPVHLMIKDSVGCTAQLLWSELIRVYPTPVADFEAIPTETTLDQPLINFTSESQGANSYNYYFGDPSESSVMMPNAAFSYKDTGSFEVLLRVGNEFGCTDQAVQTIHIGGFRAFYVPTAFTPNEDGINDVFMPKSSGFAKEGFEMRIFDRWGKEVFYSNDWEKGWDGTIDGRAVPIDMYVCKIRYFDISGNSNNHIGSVIIAE